MSNSDRRQQEASEDNFEDENDDYEYDVEEYYVVASMPYRALDKAAEVANNPNRPGARVETYNKKVMELKKMRKSD
ncbi:hypothetical protein IW150_005968, partial [Coemansia sp. RSA 2607]